MVFCRYKFNYTLAKKIFSNQSDAVLDTADYFVSNLGKFIHTHKKRSCIFYSASGWYAEDNLRISGNAAVCIEKNEKSIRR